MGDIQDMIDKEQSKQRITREKINEILFLYLEGKEILYIATQVGLSEHRVSIILENSITDEIKRKREETFQKMNNINGMGLSKQEKLNTKISLKEAIKNVEERGE